MPAASFFDYAVVRIVPHVERQEFINAGPIGQLSQAERFHWLTSRPSQNVFRIQEVT